jgi:hypothetical protein
METHVHLNPALVAPAEKWAVKGLEEFFSSRYVFHAFLFLSSALLTGCREHAFAAAVAQNMKVIHILGSCDELLLKIWAGMSG